MAPFNLNLGTKWRRVVRFMPTPLYLRVKSPAPGTHWRVGRFGFGAGLDAVK
jgi:hypothetical protein